MSENLERKSADFVLSLIKFLCIFRPGPRQNFFIAPAGAGLGQQPRSITSWRSHARSKTSQMFTLTASGFKEVLYG